MDMPATIDALVQAANTTPLSIVIIGVGPADFSSMKALDGDGKVLRDTHRRVSTRDMYVLVGDVLIRCASVRNSYICRSGTLS